MSLCHSNGHIETMPAREINPFTAQTRIRSQFLRTLDFIECFTTTFLRAHSWLNWVSQDTVIDEQSSGSEHDCASDCSAIGAGSPGV